MHVLIDDSTWEYFGVTPIPNVAVEWPCQWKITRQLCICLWSFQLITIFLLVFWTLDWLQTLAVKNFANQSDLWPWQTICNKTALKLPSCLKSLPDTRNRDTRNRGLWPASGYSLMNDDTLHKAGRNCGERNKLSFLNIQICHNTKLLLQALCDYSLISQLQYIRLRTFTRHISKSKKMLTWKFTENK